MRIRTLEHLLQFLEDDVAWRKKDLTTLRFLLQERRRSHQRKVLLRIALCALYAHWEGFVKSTADGYIEFIASRGLKYSQLAPSFVALGLRSEIGQAGVSKKPSVHTDLASKFIMGMSQRAQLRVDRARESYAAMNINSELIHEICCLLSIDSSGYLTKGQLIDVRLLRNRNLVAHGKNVDIDFDDYLDLHEKVVALVQNFRTDVENAAVMGSYRV